MTRNKDQKRIVRARMKKTGESYTAARAAVLARRNKRQTRAAAADEPAGAAKAPRPAGDAAAVEKAAGVGAGATAGYAAPRAEWASLAGMSDEAVRKKTGRTWAEWVAALDGAGAGRLSHRDIARHLAAEHGVGDWWAQMVTVGYERIRGLRDVGQRRGGGYDAGKSRTFPVDVSTLYRMFADAGLRKSWLREGVSRVRTAIVDKSIRVDWHDGTRVNAYFTAKGPDKSAISVTHEKLASKADAEAAKKAWQARLDALGRALESLR